jgi:MFS family permease
MRYRALRGFKMPDWKQIVRTNLRVLSACSPELAEELAGHLEDSYEALQCEGVPMEVAFHRTLRQIEGHRKRWLALRFLKEDLMTGFTRKVALPGLLTFASAMVIAWALDVAHVQPRTIFLSHRPPLFLSVPIAWLCLLPFCGAVGALISHRNGGSRLQRIAASLFQSAIMGAALVLGFVIGFIVSRFIPDWGWDWAFVVPALAVWLVTFTVLPAIPLLLGASVAEKVRRIPANATQ